MPCRGRAEQTVANVRRLLATAGDVEWRLICVVSQDEQPLIDALLPLTGPESPLIVFTPFAGGATYWQALTYATQDADAPLLCNLANDLWACDDWLRLAVEEYQQRFGDGPGLLGFAGDGHPPRHSCHFLISRALLDRYGGWPVWYAHNFGDAELCQRAQADECYAKSQVARLEHCHVERGLAEDDAVYQAGRATYAQDAALFEERRRTGWPSVSP